MTAIYSFRSAPSNVKIVPETLFDSKTGKISKKFKDQLTAAGIIDTESNKDIDSINKLLTKCCDEKIISFKQAENFLNKIREVPNSKSKTIGYALFPCGSKEEMRRRFYTLSASLSMGFAYQYIFFLANGQEETNEANAFISHKKSEFPKTRLRIIAVGGPALENRLSGVKALGLKGGYVVISDPSIIGVDTLARQVLINKQLVGVFSIPNIECSKNSTADPIEKETLAKLMGKRGIELDSKEGKTILCALEVLDSRLRQTRCEISQRKVSLLTSNSY